MLQNYTYNISTLSSGLKLLHIPFEDSASVFVKVVGKVGDRAEGDHEIGAAHFFEHLIFDGTPSLPTGPDVARALGRMGGNTNGYTASETVGYWARVVPEYAEGAVRWLGDIFLHSLFREEDIVKERKVIHEELVAHLDDPEEVLWDQFRGKIFAHHPLGRTVQETIDFLPNLHRKGLLAYRDRMYVAQNFVLEIAGKISKDEAVGLAEQYFNEMSSGVATPFAPVPKRTPVNFLLHKDVQQAKLILAFPGVPEWHPDAASAAVLAHVLGGGMSSRLFTILREQMHLVYAVNAHTSQGVDYGEFFVLVKLQEHKLDQVRVALTEILHDLIEHDVTDEELETARNTAEMAIALRAEEVANHVGSVGDDLLMRGKIKTIQEIMNEVVAVTKADVKRFAKQTFSTAPHVGVLVKERAEFTFPQL